MGTNLDYQAEVQLLAATETGPRAMFTGLIETVAPQQNETKITLVSGLQKLKETQSGGLGIDAGIDVPEAVWSLLRAAGVEADKIQIQGFRPGPLEVFEVATPLDGIVIDEPSVFGNVRLLPRGPVSQLADGLRPEWLRQSYSEAQAWALTLRTAPTIYEAETEGLRDIDTALAWLTTRMQYSAVALPRGLMPRHFRRDWTMSRVSRRDVIVVRGLASSRRWLRSPKDIFYRPDLNTTEIEDLDVIPLPPNLSPQMREAISEWRRAAEETEPLAAVVALCTSIEFYASGITTRKLFKPSKLKAIRKKLGEVLEGEQFERARQIVDNMLNQPSFMDKVRKALEEDGVPYTDEDLDLLQELRRIRNSFVHGSSRETPSETNLRYGKAIVNRMLVYRISRLSRPATDPADRMPVSPTLLRSISRSWSPSR